MNEEERKTEVHALKCQLTKLDIERAELELQDNRTNLEENAVYLAGKAIDNFTQDILKGIDNKMEELKEKPECNCLPAWFAFLFGLAVAITCFICFWVLIMDRPLGELVDRPVESVGRVVTGSGDALHITSIPDPVIGLSEMYLAPPAEWEPTRDHNDLAVRAAYTQLMIRQALVEMSKNVSLLKAAIDPNG